MEQEFNIKREVKMDFEETREMRNTSGLPSDNEDPQNSCDSGDAKMMDQRPDYMDEQGRIDLHRTTDAQVWAREFVHVIGNHPTADPYNEYFMLTWFANAIEIGRSAGEQAEREKDFMEKLYEIIYQTVGAATVPFMEDHPDYVFPSERVIEAVAYSLKNFGIPPRRDA